VQNDPAGTRYQFERVGYFCSDAVDSTSAALVFNRIVTLRDTWAKMTGASSAEGRPVRVKHARGDAPGTSKAKATPIVKSPELRKRAEHYISEYGLDPLDADLLTRDVETAAFFEAALDGNNAKPLARWIINDLFRELKDRSWSELPIDPKQFAALVVLVDGGAISATAAKDVLAEMVLNGGDPKEIMERLGLRQISDASAIAPVVEQIVAAHPDKAAAYRGGRTGLLGFFVGQVMARTGGRANPEVVKEIVEKQLA
jgi:glutaminyl-tRNA synthetase